MANSPSPILSLRDLRVRYKLGRAYVNAVDGVSLDVGAGETVGLVGESGCGKTTLGKAVLRLVPAAGGEILFAGQDLAKLGATALRERRREMQMVFQDPSASLNPRKTIKQLLEGPLVVQGIRDAAERSARILEIIDRVGLPKTAIERFPHEFSGGQKQRIGIARALILKPKFVVCDEPVSALDVSVQAQILNLLAELKRIYSLSYLFISHDLGVVRYIADRVIVMYMGRVVESTDHRSLWANPQHPYTRKLIAAVPGKKAPSGPRGGVDEPPAAADVAAGCRFYARCPLAMDVCRRSEPELRPVPGGGLVACHHVNQPGPRT
ncbi:MAG: ABC transporter ATP-binding protein [Reyranellaceae bacterium]